MEEQNVTQPPVGDQPQTQVVDARVDLRNENSAIAFEITSADNPLVNPAVHFAHWLGRNLSALVLLAREDWAMQRNSIPKPPQSEDAAGEGLVDTRTPRIIGPNGPLN